MPTIKQMYEEMRRIERDAPGERGAIFVSFKNPWQRYKFATYTRYRLFLERLSWKKHQ